jgi:hypothetical protein
MSVPSRSLTSRFPGLLFVLRRAELAAAGSVSSGSWCRSREMFDGGHLYVNLKRAVGGVRSDPEDLQGAWELIYGALPECRGCQCPVWGEGL